MTSVTTEPVLLLKPTLTYFHTGFLAIDQIFQVINNQSQASWDENFNFISYYNWTGSPGSLSNSPEVNNGGNGEPKAYTGMVRSDLAQSILNSILFIGWDPPSTVR